MRFNSPILLPLVTPPPSSTFKACSVSRTLQGVCWKAGHLVMTIVSTSYAFIFTFLSFIFFYLMYNLHRPHSLYQPLPGHDDVEGKTTSRTTSRLSRSGLTNRLHDSFWGRESHSSCSQLVCRIRQDVVGFDSASLLCSLLSTSFLLVPCSICITRYKDSLLYK